MAKSGSDAGAGREAGGSASTGDALARPRLDVDAGRTIDVAGALFVIDLAAVGTFPNEVLPGDSRLAGIGGTGAIGPQGFDTAGAALLLSGIGEPLGSAVTSACRRGNVAAGGAEALTAACWPSAS